MARAPLLPPLSPQGPPEMPRSCYPNTKALILVRDNKGELDRTMLDGTEIATAILNCQSNAEKLDSSRENAKSTKLPEWSRQAAMDELKLQECLVAQVCPRRLESFKSCWSRLRSDKVRAAEEAGMVGLLCMTEKQAVERCVGSLVSQAVRQATPEDSEFDDDLMAIT